MIHDINAKQIELLQNVITKIFYNKKHFNVLIIWHHLMN